MKIHHFFRSPLKSNSYIIETAPGRCVAVDIGGDSRLLIEFLKMKKLKLTKILLTHGHFDHINGVAETVSATGDEVYIHTDAAYMLESSSASLADSMMIFDFKPVNTFTAIVGDSYINDGDLTFRVLHTPGHSQGSVCYICEDAIFSGDTLFCCSIGRTDFPGSSLDAMKSSLKKIKELENDYKIYPGHNETTNLDYEKKNNPYLIKL